MPIDQKRLNGPEVSFPYHIYSNINDKGDKVKYDLSKRNDKRTNSEIRKIFLKTGVISQAKGSAYIEMGNTKVVCSVFDPREVPNKSGYCVQGEIYCEFKFASFSCEKRRIHQQNAEEKQYSLILQKALEPAVCLHEFPNFQVDVYAMVLDNAGSSLAAAIMAASVALANAGVPMFGLVTASTIGIYGNNFLVDPTDTEEAICNTQPDHENNFNHGILTLASLPQHGQISEVFLLGSIDTNSIVRATDTLTTVNKDICPVLQQCLVKTIMKLHN
ncbi:exosome complex component MTR3 [Nomia melanderi]|uniref:exosome complex component MTR3 n=1 Tax=Nomia melanderi TaxID=2448451 RepID=UPI0013041E00|nr:exosome complex component MTR3-like [Nomia melanderi]XP_031837972.1 exosome complex component MTR3-like [Nomia melanderi]XP_031837973.1 exosome complex component MTR3-like [Nomia melanderi]XP_031837974.1 exosome complex component MTR3-like [Nomia melanderi]